MWRMASTFLSKKKVKVCRCSVTQRNSPSYILKTLMVSETTVGYLKELTPFVSTSTLTVKLHLTQLLTYASPHTLFPSFTCMMNTLFYLVFEMFSHIN